MNYKTMELSSELLIIGLIIPLFILSQLGKVKIREIYNNQKNNLKSILHQPYIKNELDFSHQINRLELLKFTLSGLSLGQMIMTTTCLFVVVKSIIN